jgi:hypothetical protein
MTTIKDMIRDFLYKNGMCRCGEIYEHIKQFRPSTTKNSINGILWQNKLCFKNLGYGVWDLKNNSLIFRTRRVIYKLMLLESLYEDKLDENNIDVETRLSGVEFTEEDKRLMSKVFKQFKNGVK